MKFRVPDLDARSYSSLFESQPPGQPPVDRLPNTDSLGAGLLLHCYQSSLIFFLAYRCLILSETLLPFFLHCQHRHGRLFYHKAV